jgi:predicted aspartyl protease
MIFRTRAAFLITLLSAIPAMADDCGHLKLRATLDMTLTRGDAILVPATVNGTEMHMLLDTGGAVSSLSAKTVKALGLSRRDAGLKLLDVTGNASHQFVRLDTLELGGLKGTDIALMVAPDPNAPFDGVIAGDILKRYDVEFNFVTRKLNLFSPDHCEGQVIYWPTTGVAVVPFSMSRPMNSVPGQPARLQRMPDTHIRVPVTLDGKTFSAIIDTGAYNTSISAVTAKSAFDVTADSPGAVPAGFLNGDPKAQRFGYVFHSLAFEGIAVSNPHVVIFPDLIGKKDPNNTFVLGSNIIKADDDMGPEVTVGMDVLKRLHVYIAYQEQKLYITPPDQAPDASR